MSMPLDAHRVIRRAMLRKMAEEQAAREHIARCREQAPSQIEEAVMAVMVFGVAGLGLWLLMVLP